MRARCVAVPVSRHLWRTKRRFQAATIMLGQANKRIMHLHAQWCKMPPLAGQDGQPVTLGRGGDDDVGEAGRMALASGSVR